MRAITIDYDHRELTERDIPEPALEQPDDVLFRILQVGVCGTDRELAAFELGHAPEGDSYLVPGHEAVGEVVASSSPAFVPGDIVVPAIRRACKPPCTSCREGRRDLCVTGRFTERGIFGAHGYFTELAVDRASDLNRIPREASEFAVLVEPISVVEKAVALAFRLHPGEPARVLVLGAGSIGLLTSAVLTLRSLSVECVSVEPPESERARLAALAGAEYVNAPVHEADIVIEATGAPEAVTTGLKALAPLGVLVILGANRSPDSLPLIDMIVRNQVIAGSVNASPAAFTAAVADLPRLPRALLKGMIQYRSVNEYRASFLHPTPGAPKIVHRMV